MAKPTVGPKCRYHRDIILRPVMDADQMTCVFAATYMKDGSPESRKSYHFNIYECPRCTYIEFHDYEPIASPSAVKG